MRLPPLQVIHDTGVVFERNPSIYKGKGEEDLRDYLLLQLTPRFGIEGSATGETFNKTGKTDILIRYRNVNAFIAECKFWGGKGRYFETITQLLGYLTWRDSKAAVIIFVKNKDFSGVLQTVKNVTSEHPNFLGFVSEQAESWLNYRFHLPDDRNREIKLAVMLFHTPPNEIKGIVDQAAFRSVEEVPNSPEKSKLTLEPVVPMKEEYLPCAPYELPETLPNKHSKLGKRLFFRETIEFISLQVRKPKVFLVATSPFSAYTVSPRRDGWPGLTRSPPGLQ